MPGARGDDELFTCEECRPDADFHHAIDAPPCRSIIIDNTRRPDTVPRYAGAMARRLAFGFR